MFKTEGGEVVEIESEPSPSTEGRDFLLAIKVQSYGYTPAAVKDITELAFLTRGVSISKHPLSGTKLTYIREFGSALENKGLCSPDS